MIEYPQLRDRWRLIDGFPTEEATTSDRVVAGQPAEIEITSPTSAGRLVQQKQRDASDAAIVRGLRDQIIHRTGLTREEVASVIGLSRRTLSAWASGITHPADENFQRLQLLATLTSRLDGLGEGTARWIFDSLSPVKVDIADAVRHQDIDRVVQAAVDAIRVSSQPAPTRLTRGRHDVVLTDADFEALAAAMTTPPKSLRSVTDD